MSDSSIQRLINALALPASCSVNQRVPKKMLIENGATTAADKRLFTDSIEEIQWLAVLKPNTVGVPAWRDDEREYLEIAVLAITLRGDKPVNLTHLCELVHRAVPYPVLLMVQTPQGLSVSMAHKRWAQNEAGKVVLDGSVLMADVGTELDAAHPFSQALALRNQPQAHVMALYEGWMACLLALQAARYTGVFVHKNDLQPLSNKREKLQQYEQLTAEAASLRSQAAKAKQLAQQVELNLALQRVQVQLTLARGQLSNPTPQEDQGIS
ncbi:MAG: DUF4391 domain-containing protein [Comamonadaceae bacterium CG_4_10_14_3_um_filter_60_42]|nr:MAG: DUF4391 domain-containing protein [Comamonadaceae bacterium CG_4_10_14_3_um_filter_60_42]